MYDVFCSTQDVETGEIYVSSVFTDDLGRCFTDFYNSVRCLDSHYRLLSFHALYRSPSDDDFLKGGASHV